MSRQGTLLLELQAGPDVWVEVGFLRHSESRNWFEFSDSYWELPNRPVLGQIFEERGRAYRPSAHVALPHWFSHLLPEGRLRQAVASAAHTNSVREFELLARIGQDDLPGALRARSVTSPADLSAPPELSTNMSDEGRTNALLKFSLAGAQLKFSVRADDRGITVPAKGEAGNVILKFPDGRVGFLGVPEAELGCLELARISGIPTPRAELWDPSKVDGLEEWAQRISGQALAVHRFDRRAKHERVHMEELAQVMNVPTKPEEIKYQKGNLETVATHVAALCGTAAVGNVIDRIVLNVIVGNGDAHLKNWAFIYPDSRIPALSPVYDVLPTVLYVADDDMGLNLDGNKRFELVNAKSFRRLGARTDYGPSLAEARARESVEKIMENWSTLKNYVTAEQFQFLTKRQTTLDLLAQRIHP